MPETKYYSFSIEGGFPIIRGPYPNPEAQVATIKALKTQNKRLSGKHASEVFFLDITADGPKMGKIENA